MIKIIFLLLLPLYSLCALETKYIIPLHDYSSNTADGLRSLVWLRWARSVNECTSAIDIYDLHGNFSANVVPEWSGAHHVCWVYIAPPISQTVFQEVFQEGVAPTPSKDCSTWKSGAVNDELSYSACIDTTERERAWFEEEQTCCGIEKKNEFDCSTWKEKAVSVDTVHTIEECASLLQNGYKEASWQTGTDIEDVCCGVETPKEPEPFVCSTWKSGAVAVQSINSAELCSILANSGYTDLSWQTGEEIEDTCCGVLKSPEGCEEIQDATLKLLCSNNKADFATTILAIEKIDNTEILGKIEDIPQYDDSVLQTKADGISTKLDTTNTKLDGISTKLDGIESSDNTEVLEKIDELSFPVYDDTDLLAKQDSIINSVSYLDSLKNQSEITTIPNLDSFQSSLSSTTSTISEKFNSLLSHYSTIPPVFVGTGTEVFPAHVLGGTIAIDLSMLDRFTGVFDIMWLIILAVYTARLYFWIFIILIGLLNA